MPDGEDRERINELTDINEIFARTRRFEYANQAALADISRIFTPFAPTLAQPPYVYPSAQADAFSAQLASNAINLVPTYFSFGMLIPGALGAPARYGFRMLEQTPIIGEALRIHTPTAFRQAVEAAGHVAPGAWATLPWMQRTAAGLRYIMEAPTAFEAITRARATRLLGMGFLRGFTPALASRFGTGAIGATAYGLLTGGEIYLAGAALELGLAALTVPVTEAAGGAADIAMLTHALTPQFGETPGLAAEMAGQVARFASNLYMRDPQQAWRYFLRPEHFRRLVFEQAMPVAQMITPRAFGRVDPQEFMRNLTQVTEELRGFARNLRQINEGLSRQVAQAMGPMMGIAPGGVGAWAQTVLGVGRAAAMAGVPPEQMLQPVLQYGQMLGQLMPYGQVYGPMWAAQIAQGLPMPQMLPMAAQGYAQLWQSPLRMLGAINLFTGQPFGAIPQGVVTPQQMVRIITRGESAMAQLGPGAMEETMRNLALKLLPTINMPVNVESMQFLLQTGFGMREDVARIMAPQVLYGDLYRGYSAQREAQRTAVEAYNQSVTRKYLRYGAALLFAPFLAPLAVGAAMRAREQGGFVSGATAFTSAFTFPITTGLAGLGMGTGTIDLSALVAYPAFALETIRERAGEFSITMAQTFREAARGIKRMFGYIPEMEPIRFSDYITMQNYIQSNEGLRRVLEEDRRMTEQGQTDLEKLKKEISTSVIADTKAVRLLLNNPLMDEERFDKLLDEIQHFALDPKEAAKLVGTFRKIRSLSDMLQNKTDEGAIVLRSFLLQKNKEFLKKKDKELTEEEKRTKLVVEGLSSNLNKFISNKGDTLKLQERLRSLQRRLMDKPEEGEEIIREIEETLGYELPEEVKRQYRAILTKFQPKIVKMKTTPFPKLYEKAGAFLGEYLKETISVLGMATAVPPEEAKRATEVLRIVGKGAEIEEYKDKTEKIHDELAKEATNAGMETHKYMSTVLEHQKEIEQARVTFPILIDMTKDNPIRVKIKW